MDEHGFPVKKSGKKSDEEPTQGSLDLLVNPNNNATLQDIRPGEGNVDGSAYLDGASLNPVGRPGHPNRGGKSPKKRQRPPSPDEVVAVVDEATTAAAPPYTITNELERPGGGALGSLFDDTPSVGDQIATSDGATTTVGRPFLPTDSSTGGSSGSGSGTGGSGSGTGGSGSGTGGSNTGGGSSSGGSNTGGGSSSGGQTTVGRPGRPSVDPGSGTDDIMNGGGTDDTTNGGGTDDTTNGSDDGDTIVDGPWNNNRSDDNNPSTALIIGVSVSSVCVGMFLAIAIFHRRRTRSGSSYEGYAFHHLNDPALDGGASIASERRLPVGEEKVEEDVDETNSSAMRWLHGSEGGDPPAQFSPSKYPTDGPSFETVRKTDGVSSGGFFIRQFKNDKARGDLEEVEIAESKGNTTQGIELPVLSENKPEEEPKEATKDVEDKPKPPKKYMAPSTRPARHTITVKDLTDWRARKDSKRLSPMNDDASCATHPSSAGDSLSPPTSPVHKLRSKFEPPKTEQEQAAGQFQNIRSMFEKSKMIIVPR